MATLAAPWFGVKTVNVGALSLLIDADAHKIPHPGGMLLAHLERVQNLLDSWEARPALQMAGLCHALYGTDGFPTGLVSVNARADIANTIGVECEEIVYCYASCDRKFSYSQLTVPSGQFRDRFTGQVYVPTLSMRRDFAELTVANELDLVMVSDEVRAKHGEAIRSLAIRLEPLLSKGASRAARELVTS